MSRQKNRKYTKAEFDILRITQRNQLVEKFLDTAKTLGLAWIAYLCVDTITGVQTVFQVAVNLIANKEFATVAGYVFGAGALGVSAIRGRTRKKALKELSAQNARLQEMVDPARESTGLSSDGTPKKRRM